MPKSSALYCAISLRRDVVATYFTHFHRSPFNVRLYGDHRVYAATVTEATPEDPGDRYWAWWDEEDQEFQHVYRMSALVNMCFPYGCETEEERGRGKLMEVRVTLGDLVEDKS